MFSREQLLEAVGAACLMALIMLRVGGGSSDRLRFRGGYTGGNRSRSAYVGNVEGKAWACSCCPAAALASSAPPPEPAVVFLAAADLQQSAAQAALRALRKQELRAWRIFFKACFLNKRDWCCAGRPHIALVVCKPETEVSKRDRGPGC